MDILAPVDGEVNEQRRRRATVVLGWTAGGALGLLLAGGAYAAGLASPWLTFGLFVTGALTGAKVAERFGPRAFKPLGIAAGVLFAALVMLALSVFVRTPD